MKPSITIFFLAFLSILGCKKPSKKLDEQINIKMLESVEYGNHGNLIFSCATVKDYSCGGCLLQGGVVKNGNNITIGFTDVLVPTNCIQEPGPATTQLNLGNLDNGSYMLTINNGDKQSTATLVVTDDSYSISFSTRNDVDFYFTVLRKIPENIIWGDVWYMAASQAAMADTFTDSLVYFGAKPISGPDGYYGYFRLQDSKVVLEKEHYLNRFSIEKTFIYTYTGDPKRIDTLVHRRFGPRHDSANFRIRTSGGGWYEFPGAPVYAL